jgi:hypothetical protein
VLHFLTIIAMESINVHQPCFVSNFLPFANSACGVTTSLQQAFSRMRCAPGGVLCLIIDCMQERVSSQNVYIADVLEHTTADESPNERVFPPKKESQMGALRS